MDPNTIRNMLNLSIGIFEQGNNEDEDVDEKKKVMKVVIKKLNKEQQKAHNQKIFNKISIWFSKLLDNQYDKAKEFAVMIRLDDLFKPYTQSSTNTNTWYSNDLYNETETETKDDESWSYEIYKSHIYSEDKKITKKTKKSRKKLEWIQHENYRELVTQQLSDT